MSLRKSSIFEASVLLLVLLLLASPLAALPDGIYDSIPLPLPPNVVSQGFECCSVWEVGDNIGFAGTGRLLSTVVVTMSAWARYSEWLTYPAAGWSHPITLNLYNVDHSGANPAPGSLITSRTQTFTIPWTPVGDPTCPITYGTIHAWRASDGKCYNGFAFNIIFDFTGLNVILPDEIIFGVTYNTQHVGFNPIGTGGPYDSLNVGLRDYNKFGPLTVGSDVETDATFRDASVVGANQDVGYNTVGPVNVFRRDTGWYPYTPAVCFGTPSEPCGAAGLPVGGVVIPLNTFGMVAPWLVAIGIVSSMAALLFVARKRRRSS